MVGRLQDKVAVITGGASGIGEATVTRFAEEGAACVIADLQTDRGEALASDLGDAVCFVEVDVSSEPAVATAVDTALQRFGRLDCMFNTAGVVGAVGPIVETDVEAWDRTIAVNLQAPWLFAKAAIPVMLEAGGGSIVNVASIEATRVRRDHAVYAASKSGLVGLTRGIAVDYGRRGVRCNTISPGSVDTEMFRTYVDMADDPQAVRDELIGLNFVGRIGTEEEMGKLAVYMLSDDSGFMNGTDVVIDAGRLIGEN